MTLSTHKTLFGPQGGTILSSEKYSEQIKKAVFPGNTSNHHLHSVAGKAIAFSEMLKFGKDYAEQVVKNAKMMGQALYEKGLEVFAEDKGFTQSHQRSQSTGHPVPESALRGVHFAVYGVGQRSCTYGEGAGRGVCDAFEGRPQVSGRLEHRPLGRPIRESRDARRDQQSPKG